MRHHARKVGLGEARETTSTGGGRYQGVGKFIKGSGAGNSIVWVGNVGPFGVNGKEDRGDTHVVPANDRGKRANQLGDGTWGIPGAEGIREAAGTQSDRIYIEQWQTTVAQWVALRPLVEVCVRETGYEGGGRRSKVCCGTKRRRKNNFRPPRKTHGELKGGGAVGRWACSKTATRRERKYGWASN